MVTKNLSVMMKAIKNLVRNQVTNSMMMLDTLIKSRLRLVKILNSYNRN